MKKRTNALLLILSFIILMVSCKKDIRGLEEDLRKFLGFEKPVHFPEPAYHFDTNPVTEAGFKLGRKLFYEPRLSRNNTVSCGSCHIQSSGFTHHGHDVSHGIDDRLGRRNAPPIMNLAWHGTFNLDGGVFDLDLQPVVPITTFEEMDETLDNVLEKLRAHPEYPSMFREAFGSPEITTATLLKALSQFMVMCISSNSRYDSVMRNEAVFTATEQAGYTIFQRKCASCHKEPLFTDISYRNNGIGIGFNGDPGRYGVTLDESDRYKFKVPSLRNLKYTAPYMHDGRFYTLDAVLDKYAGGMTYVQNIDPLLDKGNGQYGIELSAEERVQLKAFLNTLNDEHFVRNKLLAE
ncbi:MAG: cytochrome-c peroxidase [Bacteroidetes bacterium 47-18]|nr:MAG: cytochrome-c peroxidase [Bacteroidetes bacterium 47-18]